MAVNLALSRQKLTVSQQQNVYLFAPLPQILSAMKKIPAGMGD